MDTSSINCSKHASWNKSDGTESVSDSILKDYNQTTSTLDSFVPPFSNEIYLTKAIVNCVIIPILVIVGVLGNMSTVIVFCRKKKKNSSNYFIICLAISDLLVLVVRGIANIYAIGHVYFMERMRYVRPHSLFWAILSYSPQRCGCLFILAIVTERFTAVWLPFKLRQIWTRKTTYVVIVAIVVLILAEMVGAIDALIFSLNESIPEQGMVSTYSEALRYNPAKNPFIKTWSFALSCILDLFPNPAILIFNLLIMIGIRRSLILRKSMTSSTTKQKDGELAKTKMLLGMSVLFTFLCSPYYAYIYLVFFNAIRSSDVPVAIYELVKLLNLLNSAINIIVYGVNNPSLREKYFKLWRCRSN